jgi:hypothetical protein
LWRAVRAHVRCHGKGRKQRCTPLTHPERRGAPWWAPDLFEATGAPLELTLAPQQCTAQVVDRLKAILADHPGGVEVPRLTDGNGRASRLRLSTTCAWPATPACTPSRRRCSARAPSGSRPLQSVEVT